MDFHVNLLLLLLQDAQQILLKHSDFGEEVLVVPAAFHVVKIHPQVQEEADAAGVQRDLLRSTEQRAPVALIQKRQFQHFTGADSD